jgi:hypothetical protein
MTWIDSEQFPSMLIQRRWQDVIHNNLIECYLQWLAPALLHLQDLNADERDWFEESACAQAMELNRHATVYPQVIDRDRLNSTLVQARMRIANDMI